MNSSRRRWLFGIAIVVFLVVLIVAILAMLGPSIGNVFSNIVSNFDDVATRIPPVDVTETINTPRPTRMLDDVTARPTQLPPTQDETGVVDQMTQQSVGESATHTPSMTPQPTQTATAIDSDSGNTTADDDADQTRTAQAIQPDRTAIDPTSGLSSQGAEQTATAIANIQVTSPVDSSDTDATDVPFATAQAARDIHIIGNGSAYVFHDDTVAQNDNTLVELRVFFDEFYITATPTSAITPMTAPELARPEVDPLAEQTPRAARFSDEGIELSDRLIAWLDCNDQFDHCGSGGVLPMRIQSPNSWRWSITPKDGVRGMQDLRVELWTIDSSGERDQRVWTHDFQIGVDVDFLAENNTRIILILIGVIMLMLVIFGGLRWRDHREANRKRPKVFISYRRLVSAGFGRALHDSLVAAGADVFIDIDDIHAGSFSEYIKDNIRERDYFLVLLAPRTLESTWVVQEILYALEHDRTIIPVLLNDFDLYGDEMPDNLTFLQQQNAVTLPVEHFESGVGRIKTFIGLK